MTLEVTKHSHMGYISEFFGDVLKAHAFITKALSFGQIPFDWTRMDLLMFGVRDNLKIAYCVVSFVFVFVMDYLGALQFSSNTSLHDCAMTVLALALPVSVSRLNRQIICSSSHKNAPTFHATSKSFSVFHMNYVALYFFAAVLAKKACSLPPSWAIYIRDHGNIIMLQKAGV